VKWLLRLGSSHGDRAPLPFITSVEVNYPNRPDLKQKLLKKQPFVLRRETMHVKELDVSLTLHFGEGCMCVTANILQSLHFEVTQTYFSI
jgi:mono-ADP-ribosyltransferase sirtuin 6